jgi:phosphoribosylglycinamide formyltransferase-1
LIDTSDLGAHIALVVSDRPGAGALTRAGSAGIDAEVIPYIDFADRDHFSAAIVDAVHGAGAEAIVMAGFMRILAPNAVREFPNRILNIHPSLLPAFPGAHAIAQALAYGVKTTGVTVHFVDEEVDHGPIIAQRPVPVHDGDSEDVLRDRIQAEEHRLYPEVIRAFASDRITVVGREVIWR